MENKSFFERYKDEKLTDNSRIDRYEQCKNCFFNDDGEEYEINGRKYINRYDRGNCAIFQYPENKPSGVMENKVDCKFRESDEN